MQAFEQQPIETMRNYFHEALHNNPKVSFRIFIETSTTVIVFLLEIVEVVAVVL